MLPLLTYFLKINVPIKCLLVSGDCNEAMLVSPVYAVCEMLNDKKKSLLAMQWLYFEILGKCFLFHCACTRCRLDIYLVNIHFPPFKF